MNQIKKPDTAVLTTWSTKALSDSVNQKTNTKRFLLCRPRGGLNDTLCQIEWCWRYAQKFGRHLIIDTTNSSLFGHFDDFFEITDNSIQVSSRLTTTLIQELNRMTCKPEILSGVLHEYKTKFVAGSGFVEINTKQPSRFGSHRTTDFETDFCEQLLVYEDSGGGDVSQDLLKKIQLTKHVCEKIANANSFLQSPYYAVHVRNTDYQTDYQRFFKKIQKTIADNSVLICSDDPAVIEYGKTLFSGQVHFFNRRLDSQDPTGALHKAYSFSDKQTQQQVVIDSFIDLIGLANAKHLFISSVDKVLKGIILRDHGQVVYKNCFGTLSGFSQLAAFLCLNKKILRSLLNNSVVINEENESAHVTIIRYIPLSRRFLHTLKKTVISICSYVKTNCKSLQIDFIFSSKNKGL